MKTSKTILTSLIVCLSLLISLISCSKGNNPAVPDYAPGETFNGGLISTVVKTGENSNLDIIGLFSLSLDTRSQTASLTPLRSLSARGDSYQVDVTSFFTINPCPDCLRIAGLELEADNSVTLKMGLKHPYKLPYDINNPQLNERLDLHIFDVEGIIIMEGTSEFPYTKSDINADGSFAESILTSADILRNADGYTSIHDTFFDTFYPTDSNIHPYRIFAKDGSEGNYNPTYDPNNGYPFLDYPSGHNVFRQGGAEVTEDFNLLLPPGNYDFLFALSASYGQSAARRGVELGQLGNPRYFLPEFNRKEPWMVTVDITGNTLKGNTPSTFVDLDIQIRDWQNTAVVDPNFNFYTSLLSSTSRESRIREVSIEIPAFQKYFDEYNLPPPSGDGSNSNPLRYQFRMYNDSLVDEGTYYGLVTARDDLEGSLSEMGVERDGVTIFPINDFSTYQVFRLEVMSADFPPTAIITSIPDPIFVGSGESFMLDGSMSFDDGTIVSYEWDLDFCGNPALFHVDATGPMQSWSYQAPGTYSIALRITDNHVPPQQDLTKIQAQVNCKEYSPPVCSVSTVPTWLVTSHNEDWETQDGKIDLGFLSNGDVVIEDNEELGRADVSPSGGAIFYPFISGYPGNNVGSIDIDRHNRVLWVDYYGPDDVIIGTLEYRNSKYGNILHVFDTWTNAEIATINLGIFGDRIQAIDTDEDDNAWVIMDNDNFLKCRSSDYQVVVSSVRNLRTITSQNDIGLVFDMAINFHNDCFYILTDKHDKGSVYRIECDMTFDSTVNGNPNPVNSVFEMVGGFPLIGVFGDDALADIEIDNFAGIGYNNILDGQQDCQIILYATGVMATTQLFASKTIMSADLEFLARELTDEGFGTHAIGIIPDGTNYIYSIVYGNTIYLPPGCSDKEMDVYIPPAGWL